MTVAGVRAVVDSGEARVMRHEPGAGIDRLKVERIDRAAADQRAGRAGRLGPGLCLRLWSAVDDRNLESALEPEVRRLDVAGAVLQLALWGESDVGSFPWFEAPRAEATARALELLGASAPSTAGGRSPAAAARWRGSPSTPDWPPSCMRARGSGSQRRRRWRRRCSRSAIRSARPAAPAPHAPTPPSRISSSG